MARPAGAAAGAALEVDFWRFFEQSPSPWLVLHGDSPRFSVAFANDAYLGATRIEREGILGQPAGDVSPLGRAAGNEALESLQSSLERVLETGACETLAVQRYRRQTAENGGFEELYFSAQNTPLCSPAAGVPYLSHRLEDLTLLVSRAASGERAGEREQLLTERTACLGAAQRELEALTYSISHDVRAPLRAIDGFSEALATDHAGALGEEGRHYLERIRAGARRMSMLMDDLLDLARIHQDPLRLSSIDLADLAQKVISELEAREPNRLVRFRVTKGMVARGDRQLIRTLLEQLLGNAWKFTAQAPSAEILFSEDRSGRSPRYCISDNGVGFDMKYSDRLFSPFQRLHAAEEFKGTGVGLAAARRILARHGGDISIEAEVGRGARVYFTLGEHGAPWI